MRPDLNQLFRIDNISESLHALEGGVVAFFGVGSDAVTHDHHEVTAMIAVADGGFDATVGGAADHDHCHGSPIRKHSFKFIADEHRRTTLVDNDIIFTWLEGLH